MTTYWLVARVGKGGVAGDATVALDDSEMSGDTTQEQEMEVDMKFRSRFGSFWIAPHLVSGVTESLEVDLAAETKSSRSRPESRVLDDSEPYRYDRP